jgi:decaprenylphospho-beta-D-ribofuranose 2-oxidase
MGDMNKVLKFDPENAKLTVQAGVSICDILRIIVPAGFYLTGLSGSYTDTIGGMISSNCHGKDSWRHGNVGNNVEKLKLMDCKGDVIIINKSDERIKAVIGGLGALGVITEVTLKLSKLPSTVLSTQSYKTSSAELNESLSLNVDYKYGWMDMSNAASSRVIIKTALFDLSHSNATVLPAPSRSIFGLEPPVFWGGVRWFWNANTYHVINRIIVTLNGSGKRKLTALIPYLYPWLRYPQNNYLFPHGRFYELQCLFSTSLFQEAMAELKSLMATYRIYPMVSGVKWHKADNFFLSFSGNGMSLSTAFDAGSLSTEAGRRFVKDYVALAVSLKGKFYLSKYPYLSPTQLASTYSDLSKWITIKRELDPQNVFLSDRISTLTGITIG